MGIVTLPVVRPETTVTDALKVLRRERRGGVVVHGARGRYWVVHASDLYAARRQQVETVAGARKHQVLLIDNASARTFGVDLVRPWHTEQRFDKLFEARGADFALALEMPGQVAVVTRHEGQEEALSTTGGLRCDGRPTHRFPEPLVHLGQPCPLYPECSRPGGGRTTIRRG